MIGSFDYRASSFRLLSLASRRQGILLIYFVGSYYGKDGCYIVYGVYRTVGLYRRFVYYGESVNYLYSSFIGSHRSVISNGLFVFYGDKCEIYFTYYMGSSSVLYVQGRLAGRLRLDFS